MGDLSPPPSYGKVDLQTEPLIHNSPPGRRDDVTVVTLTRNQTANQRPPVEYDNCHLVWAVISAFCCSAFGIVAVVMSLLGYTDHRTGNYIGYRKKRRCAIAFLVLGIIIGAIVITAYGVCYYYHGDEAGVRQMTKWVYTSEDDDSYHN